MEAKLRRRQALQDTRQSMVLAAAKKVIARVGLEGASIRQIAQEAGYTPGALYAFFDSKQALFLALLDDSLARLTQSVAQARVSKGQAAQALLIKGEAWIVWFVEHPQELQLLLYFVNGEGRQAIKPEAALQARHALRSSLQPLADGLSAMGLAEDAVTKEVEALTAHGLGLLIAQETPEDPANKESVPHKFADYLRRVLLVLSVGGGKAGMPDFAVTPEGPGPQPDLFR